VQELTARARGWLRFVHRKATAPLGPGGDDWSSGGRPAAWWDDRSTPPVLNFPRFDLSESSYALALLADTTPAWREVYAAALDGLIRRHVTHWAAVDWLTQLGPDPARGSYPEELVRLWLPPGLAGSYDMPGWTANGVPPWGLQPDPVGADGNLFFKGWLNLLMGLHRYVSGEATWDAEFLVTGLDDAQFAWSHSSVNDLLVRQWTARPEGPHCENTKVWPYCLSAAGLGLRLHDVLRGTSGHEVFGTWLEIARSRFLGLDGDRVEWMALYWDPLLDYVHRPTAGLSVALYVLPQDEALARVLYTTAVDRIGWSDPGRPVRSLPDPRFLCLGLVLARELGDAVTYGRLSAYTEEHFEPAFFGDGMGDFGWWFGYGEPWPRGQLTALLAMAEAGPPGAWARLFTRPNLAKFGQPTVVGVDYPSVGLSTAEFDADAGVLELRTYAATTAAAGRPTAFRVENVPDVEALQVRCDGAEFGAWSVTAPGTVELRLDVGEHALTLLTGPALAGGAGARTAAAATPAPDVTPTAADVRAAAADPGGCPCC
jgi:hypothetical protein